MAKKAKKGKASIEHIEWLKSNFVIKPEMLENPDIGVITEDVAEQVEYVIEKLEQLIIINENYRSYLERAMLTKQEKENIFKMYRALLSILWDYNATSLVNTKESYVKWIEKLKNIWENNKKDIIDIFSKLSLKWKNFELKEAEIKYTG